MTHEATAEVLGNLLKHGKFPQMARNALENAVDKLKPVEPEYNATMYGTFKSCGECGTSLRSYDKFCPECGRGVK